jgi:hypothetical protein
VVLCQFVLWCKSPQPDLVFRHTVKPLYGARVKTPQIRERNLKKRYTNEVKEINPLKSEGIKFFKAREAGKLLFPLVNH